MSLNFSRRQFVGVCSSACAALLVPQRGAWARSQGPHPTPRPGITGDKVLTKAQLADHPKLVALFDSVREIPEIVDGIHCNCGCTNPPEFYSLLSCYEDRGMARDCAICQGQGRLVVRFGHASLLERDTVIVCPRASGVSRRLEERCTTSDMSRRTARAPR